MSTNDCFGTALLLVALSASSSVSAMPCGKDPWSLWKMKAGQRLASGEYVGTIPGDGKVTFEGKQYKYVLAKPSDKEGFDSGAYFAMHRALSGFFEPTGLVDVTTAAGDSAKAVHFIQCEKTVASAPKPGKEEATKALFEVVGDANQAKATKRAASLLANGADPNEVVSNGWETAFLKAASGGSPELLKLLIKNGADVKAQGANAVCQAVYAKNVANIKALAAAGASLDGYQSPNGAPCSPIKAAIQQLDIDSVRALATLGATLNIKSNGLVSNSTPLAYARINDGTFKISADLCSNASIAKTPQCVFARKQRESSEQIIKILVDAGAKSDEALGH